MEVWGEGGREVGGGLGGGWEGGDHSMLNMRGTTARLGRRVVWDWWRVTGEREKEMRWESEESGRW